MTQIPVQLLMSFETLIETVRSLNVEDQLRLQSLLNQEIDRRRAQSLPEKALQDRGLSFPLKTGLSASRELISGDRTDVSINHDQVVVESLKID